MPNQLNRLNLKANEDLGDFYDCTSIAAFHPTRFSKVYENRSKKMANRFNDKFDQDEESESSNPATSTQNPDQIIISSTNPIFNLNNLKDLTFQDFCVLYRICPKIFMLDNDYNSL